MMRTSVRWLALSADFGIENLVGLCVSAIWRDAISIDISLRVCIDSYAILIGDIAYLYSFRCDNPGSGATGVGTEFLRHGARNESHVRDDEMYKLEMDKDKGWTCSKAVCGRAVVAVNCEEVAKSAGPLIVCDLDAVALSVQHRATIQIATRLPDWYKSKQSSGTSARTFQTFDGPNHRVLLAYAARFCVIKNFGACGSSPSAIAISKDY
ncbi:hypothetical protein A7U60_g2970 [Sanghuangporus baumii]|uniref:Uncharacterized protein n=1 Tax=Sanghuangporus baumii TaxID=108892 RepID=A0A9Q5I1E1_SANBA|nr:hypothetical protein A7U60_g2970 [Sanghuangporus baumii]